jgi:hypothetical protein
MDSGPLVVIFFAVGFGCVYWTSNIVTAVCWLLGISIVLAGIAGIATQGWGIVVLLLYPHVWLPALMIGAVLGWAFRWISEPKVKEKSE